MNFSEPPFCGLTFFLFEPLAVFVALQGVKICCKNMHLVSAALAAAGMLCDETFGGAGRRF